MFLIAFLDLSPNISDLDMQKQKFGKSKAKEASIGDCFLIGHFDHLAIHTKDQSIRGMQQLISAAWRYYEKGEIPTFSFFIFSFDKAT